MNIRGCFEKEDIIYALRSAGVKEHTNAPPISTPEKGAIWGSSSGGSSSSYASAPAPSREPRSPADGLAELSISQLKRVARERKVDISRCFEKADLVRALRPPTPPPAASSTLPCIRVLPRTRPAPPVGLPPGRQKQARETSPPIPVSRRSFDEDWDARYRRRAEEEQERQAEEDRRLNEAVNEARRQHTGPRKKSVNFAQETRFSQEPRRRTTPPSAFSHSPSYDAPLEATG